MKDDFLRVFEDMFGFEDNHLYGGMYLSRDHTIAIKIKSKELKDKIKKKLTGKIEIVTRKAGYIRVNKYTGGQCFSKDLIEKAFEIINTMNHRAVYISVQTLFFLETEDMMVMVAGRIVDESTIYPDEVDKFLGAKTVVKDENLHMTRSKKKGAKDVIHKQE